MMKVYKLNWMRWLFVGLFALATFSPWILPLDSVPEANVSAQTATYEPRFEPDFCPVRSSFDLAFQCGYLIVPEDRNNPEANQVRLAVVVVKSTADNPELDPILMVQGSLGMDSIGAGLPLIEQFYTHWLDKRDIIILDQRGAGFSEPALNCPEMELLYFERIGLNLTQEEDTALANAAAKRCYDRLGVDTRFYNVEQSVLDIRDLRIAMDIEEWNVFAISLATRTVLSLIRDYPEGIRSVILDAPLPPEVIPAAEGLAPLSYGYHELLEACANNAECQADHPDLEADMIALVQKLNENPVVVPVWHPIEEDTTEYYLDGNIAISQLFGLISATGLTARIPNYVDMLLDEDYLEYVRLVSQQLTLNLFFAEGALISAECYAGQMIPAETEPVLETLPMPDELLQAILTGQKSPFSEHVCDIWPTEGSSENYYDPVESDIPALFIMGHFDTLAIPQFSKIAVERLPNGVFIEVPGLGHGVLKNECPIEIATQFLDSPTGELDINCLDKMPVFEYGNASH